VKGWNTEQIPTVYHKLQQFSGELLIIIIISALDQVTSSITVMFKGQLFNSLSNTGNYVTFITALIQAYLLNFWSLNCF
jgi:hypothetical protein